MAEREHIILFPYMAQGHLIPFLSLANLIHQRTNYKITIVNTPRNIQKLRSSLPSDTKIHLAELPFNSSDHGLPPNTENTDSLPYPLILRLTEASQTLLPHFENLISVISEQDGRPPLCIVSDFFFGWTVEIAHKLNIFHSVFLAQGAYGTAVFFSLWLNLPHCQTDSEEFPLPDFPEPVNIHRTQLSNHLKTAVSTDSWSRFIQRQLDHCLKSGGLLLNSVAEMENNAGLLYFSRKMCRPPWTIGPIGSVLKKKQSFASKEPGISVNQCIEWLNLHRPCSVLYISFGSMNTISASQMMELAMGLEASRNAFIWVIRPPLGFDIAGEFRPEWLPEGFEDRITDRKQGILVRQWAPQLEVLSHRSTAVFLSHCGWNSVLESLGCGVPMIGWPISAEQFYNSKMLEEKIGVCVEIARGNYSEIGRDHVRRVIELVMGEEGEEMRRRAKEVRETMEAAIREDEGFKGSSIQAMEDFIRTASSMKNKTSRA